MKKQIVGSLMLVAFVVSLAAPVFACDTPAPSPRPEPDPIQAP